MLKLAHQILLQRNHIRYPADLPTDARKLFSGYAVDISRGAVILADNVASYCSSAGWKEFDSYKEFFNLAPPWPISFIEWGGPFPEPFFVHGYVSEEELPEDGDEIEGGVPVVRRGCSINATPRPTGGWELIVTSWCLLKTGQVFFPGILVYVYVKDNGELEDIVFQSGRRLATASENDKKPAEIIGLFSVLSAIQFCHCKNVALTDATETEGPSKRWLRRQRQPAIQYNTISIEPTSRRRSGETANDDSSSRPTALHICRGHFREYEDGHGPFGRAEGGIFWIPSHTRGSLDAGRVISDYKVKAPDSEAVT